MMSVMWRHHAPAGEAQSEAIRCNQTHRTEKRAAAVAESREALECWPRRSAIERKGERAGYMIAEYLDDPSVCTALEPHGLTLAVDQHVLQVTIRMAVGWHRS
jgi:hypothetical protein